MIILVTYEEKNQRTGRSERYVSHGVHAITGRNVILPDEPLSAFNPTFDKNLGEYVIQESPRHSS